MYYEKDRFYKIGKRTYTSFGRIEKKIEEKRKELSKEELAVYVLSKTFHLPYNYMFLTEDVEEVNEEDDNSIVSISKGFNYQENVVKVLEKEELKKVIKMLFVKNKFEKYCRFYIELLKFSFLMLFTLFCCTKLISDFFSFDVVLMILTAINISIGIAFSCFVIKWLINYIKLLHNKTYKKYEKVLKM